MRKRIYLVTRDLHLYAGLFISPFVLVFAVSVIFLVHAWIPGTSRDMPARTRTVRGLHGSPEIENLSGRRRVDAVRDFLAHAGVRGEIGFIQHIPAKHRLIVPVSVPGRETTVEIDLQERTAEIRERATGLADALVTLHKSPGPHLADIRMNWLPMLVWRWMADATVYLMLFISISGIYLWTALRAERRVGIALLAFGAVSLFGIVYGLVS